VHVASITQEKYEKQRSGQLKMFYIHAFQEEYILDNVVKNGNIMYLALIYLFYVDNWFSLCVYEYIEYKVDRV